jgi:hypothetical protein
MGRGKGKVRCGARKRRADGQYIPPAHRRAQSTSFSWPQSCTVELLSVATVTNSRGEDDDTRKDQITPSLQIFSPGGEPPPGDGRPTLHTPHPLTKWTSQ